MSDEHLVRKFFEVFNRRDSKEMENLLDPQAEFYFPKTRPLIGKERILKFLKILFRQYPELSFRIERIIQQGDRAAVHWTNRGIDRHEDPYQNEGVTLLELQDGRIRFISDFFKDTEKF